MSRVPSPHEIRSVRLSRTVPRVGTLLVLLAVAALVAVAPARATTWPATPSYVWSNGTLTCVFNASTPTVNVSASALSRTGMGIGLDQVLELTPAGTTVAAATVRSVTWDPTNASSNQWFEMDYSQAVPVLSASLPSHQVGTAQVGLTFSLVRNLSLPVRADQVSIALTVGSWPWQGAPDRLAFVVPLWSDVPSVEHMEVSSATSPTVQSVSSSTGQPQEYFTAGATARTGSGSTIPVTAASTVAGGNATMVLTLAPAVSGASLVTYQATAGISPTTPVLGIPLYVYAAVAGGAGLVALFVGVGTRQIRRRPSDLTYVEESE